MNGTIRYTIRPYDTIWMLAQVFNTTVDSIMDLNPGIEPRNLMIGQVINIRPGYSRFPSYSDVEGTGEEHESDAQDYDENELDELFRMLWEEHIVWTRMAVMGIIHDLPETDQIVQRLLRNPQDFAKALAPYFGADAAKEFADLLSAHLTIASELVKAAKAGDSNATADADRRWHENADQIAQLLGDINSEWSTEDWEAMMNEHLALLSDNVADMLEGKYEDSINGFDNIEAQALEMADMMANGIAAMSPD